MKTEVEIREWLTKLEGADLPTEWFTSDGSPRMIPISEVKWYAINIIKKMILGDIPVGILGFYCIKHEQSYLAESSKDGCEKCRGEKAPEGVA